MIDILEPLVLTHPELTSREADFWPTPAWVTHALLDCYPPPKRTLIVEPAVGDGAIARVLRERGYRDIWGVDIRRECNGQAGDCCNVVHGGKDWLRIDLELPPEGFSIVTNPPFSLAREFLLACRRRDPVYLALLLPASAIAGTQEWRPVWAEAGNPTGEVRLLARPKFGGPGNDRQGTLWAVWERGKPPLAIKYV